MAFRELDTLHPIVTTTFQNGCLISYKNNNIIAVGDSAGLDQDSVAIFMFKGMDTKSALPTAEKSEERDEGMMSLDSLFFFNVLLLNIKSYISFLSSVQFSVMFKDSIKWFGR